MSSEETPKRKSSLGWILCAAAMVVVFLLGMLAASINERKAEVASIYNNKKIELTQTNAKNGDWGLNYPREYETWKMTEKGDFKSKYNGNDEHDVLADRPNMVILWAGYAFSQDYTKPRGHMHAIEDMRRTLRTGAPMDGKGCSPAPAGPVRAPMSRATWLNTASPNSTPRSGANSAMKS